MNRNFRIVARFEEHDYQQLELLAKINHVKLTELVRRICKAHLDGIKPNLKAENMIHLTEAELDDLSERSKIDAIIVGSEVRQLVMDVRQARQDAAELQLWCDLRKAADEMAMAKWTEAHDGEDIPEHIDLVIFLLNAMAAKADQRTLPCDVMLPPGTIVRKGCNLSVLLTALKAREGRDQTSFDNQIETATAGVIDWKMEATRANRLYAELQRTFDFQWDADMRAVKRWREATPGNEMVLPDRVNLVLFLLQQIETAERLDRTDEALAQRVGIMIEQKSALKVWLAEWLKCYALDIFPEPDLAKAAEVLKANGMTIDSLSANMGRHVLGRVLKQLDDPDSER